MAEFLTALSKKLALDAKSDEKRGRKKLAYHLAEASKQIKEASTHINHSWDICAPYMQKWCDENENNRH